MVRWKYMSSNKKNTLNLHPWKFIWNSKITQMTRNIIFLTSTFGFHVNFPGWKSRISRPGPWMMLLWSLCWSWRMCFFRGLFINDYRLNHDNHDVSIFLGLLFQSQTEKYNTNLGCYLYCRQGTGTVTVTVTIDLWFIWRSFGLEPSQLSTSQWCGDYKKPSLGSLLNNQYNGK